MGEEMIELYFAACNDRNMTAIRNMLTDDIEWTAPGGVSLKGPDQCVAFISVWPEAFSDCRWELKRHIIGEEIGAFEATLTGTHDGTLHTPGGDIPPTGRQVTLPFAGIFNLVDGQIARKRIYFDVAGFLADLGVGTALVEAQHLQ
jgi:steroid delta-isomerase-like uncharacterized protein